MQTELLASKLACLSALCTAALAAPTTLHSTWTAVPSLGGRAITIRAITESIKLLSYLTSNYCFMDFDNMSISLPQPPCPFELSRARLVQQFCQLCGPAGIHNYVINLCIITLHH